MVAKLPLSTGEAARVLGTTEPRLAELVRRGLIQPTPEIVAGRRLWYAVHLRQAGKRLRLLDSVVFLRIAALEARG